jgi:hypothetical protein
LYSAKTGVTIFDINIEYFQHGLSGTTSDGALQLLGNGLGPLGHGVLGQLAGQQQADGGLDLTGGDGRPEEELNWLRKGFLLVSPLVVVCELAGLGGNPLRSFTNEFMTDMALEETVNLLQHLHGKQVKLSRSH